MPLPRITAMVFALILQMLAETVLAADWPQFRGPEGNGRLATIEHPLEWSKEKNLAWTTKIPGAGWSSPVVVGNRIFLTTAVAEDGSNKPKDMAAGSRDPRSMPFIGVPKPPDTLFRFEVHCLDLETGKSLWKQVALESKPKIPVHPSNTYATESPAADNERVYSFFGTVGLLVCHDHEGKKLWEKQYEVFPVTLGFGSGSSLALLDGRLYLQRDNDSQSSLTAFDAKSGEEIWSAARDSKSAWSTPYLWRTPRGTELIACGSGSVIAHDPITGSERWKLGGITSSFSASPTATPTEIFFGSSGPLSTSPLYAVKANAAGDITLAKGSKANDFVAWSRTGSGPGMASPFVAGNYLYVPGDGILKVFDTKSGKELFKQRLPNGKIVVSSPWGTEDTIFLHDESGQTFVVKAGEKFELLGINKIEDTFWSSPAPAGTSLVLRGVEGIYCIRQ